MSYLQAAQWISKADAIVIATGAGMGVDSGLPDFRGNEGFWNAYPPYAEKGLQFTDMANPAWFSRDPGFAWGFYGHRLNLYRKTVPHQGFNLLKKWAEKMKHGYFCFTSNVDGQFQKAGYDPNKIIEVHGSIHQFQCLNNCGQGIYDADPYTITIDESTMRAEEPYPSCPKCSGLARPNILMFGDWGWDSSREEIQSMHYRNWLEKISGSQMVIVECGAGTAVPTVRYQSESLASQFRGKIIRINVRESHVPGSHIGLAVGALEGLSEIDALL